MGGFGILLLISFIVAHVQQETGTGTICINDPVSLRNYLTNTLQPALDLVKSPRRASLRLHELMLMVM